MTLFAERMRWRALLSAPRKPELRVALLSTFTVDPLVPYLGLALEDAKLPIEPWVGPFNQIGQQCVDPASELSRFRPDALVVWPRLADVWAGMPLPLSDSFERYAAPLLSLGDLALNAARRLGATLVFVLPALPDTRPLGVGDASNPVGVAAAATTAREQLRARLSQSRGTLLCDADDSIRQLGQAQAYDPRLAAMARIPFSEALFAAVGASIARLILLSRRPAKKLVVVDGDNTLWGGVLGEDGAAHLEIGDSGAGLAFQQFQEMLLELRRAGVLIALVSKNDERDVWPVFQREEMRLRREHLAAARISWRPKSSGIREIADELGLGLDAVVFIDDNPAELAEVRAALPEVTAVLFPADPSEWRAAVLTGVLDRLPPTTEDLSRAEFYSQEQQRREHQTRATTPAEYLRDLDVRVGISPVDAMGLPRLAQLIAKTNQFNLNGQRRSEAELSTLLARDGVTAALVRAQDRFGDYGVIGAFIVERRGSDVRLDTFVLSCRAMGRGIEEAMIASLFEASSAVVARLEELPRNEPARTFFHRLGCETFGVEQPLQRVEWPAHVRRI